MDIPLFPLRTVLFPGGPLPLRIFESRYIDMISRCMKSDTPFGVLLIREGQEVGISTTYEVGTLAHITDWYQGSDGLLGVTAAGGQRFRLLSGRRQADGLNLGTVEVIAPEPEMALPAEYESLKKILESVLDDLGRLSGEIGTHDHLCVGQVRDGIERQVLHCLPSPRDKAQNTDHDEEGVSNGPVDDSSDRRMRRIVAAEACRRLSGIF